MKDKMSKQLTKDIQLSLNKLKAPVEQQFLLADSEVTARIGQLQKTVSEE